MATAVAVAVPVPSLAMWRAQALDWMGLVEGLYALQKAVEANYVYRLLQASMS